MIKETKKSQSFIIFEPNFLTTISNIKMDFLEILKYVLPSLVVLLCTYIMMTQFFKREREKDILEHEKLKMDFVANNAKITTPIRVAAYERLTLFLERINPENMIVRVIQPGMTALELQRALLLTVRAEYEHNVSQQIYVSANAWKAIVDTKELITEIINKSAQTVNIDIKASDLGKKIIDVYSSQEKEPIQMAVEVLKSEIAVLF